MIDSLANLVSLMQSHGATRFYAKRLSPNDNSKNQIYLGGDFSALHIVPHGTIETDGGELAGSKRDRLKADVSFFWVDESGLSPAPYAQLILYPKYPEVRMSGFLRGSKSAPTDVLTVRDQGRSLVFGITHDGRVLGYASGSGHPVSTELLARTELEQSGVFVEIPPLASTQDTRTVLLSKLKEIYQKNWIESKKLGSDGIPRPYSARNGGGYTLEAELGIAPNGYAEPDYLGWEIKQYSVRDFRNYAPKSPVTLMTPEPTAGVYRDSGVETFIRRFGYADVSGIADRWNFGGVHSCVSGYHARTNLRLELLGYDGESGKISDINGGIALVSSDGEVAALWKYIGMLEHWDRKHAQAAYVPSLFQKPPPEYRYGPKVLLCEETDFSLFLKAVNDGVVYYDPGIKMEQASSSAPLVKRRSQFRVTHKNLPSLYKHHQLIGL